MTLVYCQTAAAQELLRRQPWDHWNVLHKRSLGLVPVVDGRCACCGKKVRTVIS